MWESGSVRRLTVVVAAARPIGLDLPDHLDAAVFLRDSTVGHLSYGTAVGSYGHEVATWAVLPNVIDGLLDDVPLVVLNDRCWVTGELDELILAPASDGLAGLARRVDGRVASGGWIPEMIVAGPNSSAALAAWTAHAQSQVSNGSVSVDPWAEYPTAGGVVTTVVDGRFRRSPHAAAGSPDDLANTIAHRQIRLVNLGAATSDAPWAFFARPMGASIRGDERAAASNLAEVRASVSEGLAALDGAEDDFLDDHVGFGLDHRLRRSAARESLALGEVPPDPYAAGGTAATLSWLSTGGSATGTQRSRWLDALWRDRPDLRATFPSPRWRDRAQLDRWQWVSGVAEGNTPIMLLPDLPGRVPAGEKRRVDGGVSIVGFLDAQLGLGEAARRLRAGLDAADVPTNAVRYDRHASRRADDGAVGPGARGLTDRPDRRIVVLAVAPTSVPQLLDDLAEELDPTQQLVGAFYWETDELSDDAMAGVRAVDRIWASTKFLVDVFTPVASGPVELVPIPLEFPLVSDRAGARARAGFDDRFTFLFSFDVLSVPRRKNPDGLIAAYLRAFPQDTGTTRLVLKTMNGASEPEMVQRWWHLGGGRSDIEIRDEDLSATARLELVASADCYVSLHRSEGLGLTMAEAMSQHVPVIATGYGGNLDFMDESSALLVPYSMVDVGPGCPYPERGRWADPDVDAAAEMMIRVATDRATRDRLADAGAHSLGRFTLDRVVPLIRRAAVRAAEH